MRRLWMTIVVVGIAVPAVRAQDQNPVQDPSSFVPARRYADDFAPPLGAVYRNESATFVLDGPKKAGVADYRWHDGRHFRDNLRFDPSCSLIRDQRGEGVVDPGYLYRVPEEPFWFFFSDEGVDLPGKDAPRYRVYYSQDGKTFFRYSTPGGTTRIPFPGAGGARGKATEHIPSRLNVRIGGLTGSVHVTLRDGSLVYRVIPGPPDSPTKVKVIVPTEGQWRTFRSALDELGVWQWRQEYPKPPNIADGTIWDARIEYPGKALVTRGENNYPGDGAAEPKVVGQPSEAFQRYLAAVEALLGGESFR